MNIQKIYGTSQELWIQAFTEQSSVIFAEIFSINGETFNNYFLNVPHYIMKSSVHFPELCFINAYIPKS